MLKLFPRGCAVPFQTGKIYFPLQGSIFPYTPTFPTIPVVLSFCPIQHEELSSLTFSPFIDPLTYPSSREPLLPLSNRAPSDGAVGVTWLLRKSESSYCFLPSPPPASRYTFPAPSSLSAFHSSDFQWRESKMAFVRTTLAPPHYHFPPSSPRAAKA